MINFIEKKNGMGFWGEIGEEMNPEMSPEIGRRKKYNYANDLVKIQVCASFHMPAHQLADTLREVLLKLVELCVGASLRRTNTPGGGGGRTQQRFIRGGN